MLILPPELIVQVAAHFQSPTVHGTRTLINLALTSSEMHELVAPFLYKTLVVGKGEKKHKSLCALIERWVKNQRAFGTSHGRYVCTLLVSHITDDDHLFASHFTNTLLPNIQSVHFQSTVAYNLAKWERMSSLGLYMGAPGIQQKSHLGLARNGSTQHPVHAAVHRVGPKQVILNWEVEDGEWGLCTRDWTERLVRVLKVSQVEYRVSINAFGQDRGVPGCVEGARVRYVFYNNQDQGDSLGMERNKPGPGSISTIANTSSLLVQNSQSDSIIKQLHQLFLQSTTTSKTDLIEFCGKKSLIQMMRTREEEWLSSVNQDIVRKVLLSEI